VDNGAQRRANQSVREAPMSRYWRLKIEGGALLFTLALAGRGSDLLVRHIERLRRVLAEVEKRRPFRFDE
jgi:putative transposase